MSLDVRWRGVALASLAIVSCHKANPADRVLARVGERTITERDLQRRIDESSPLVRARYATVERRRELLESMVRNELLLQEARRRHLDEAPEVRAQLDRAMVQELLRTVATSTPQASDAEVEKVYAENRGEYLRPATIQASHIFLVADSRNRSSVRADAEKLRREIDERQQRGDGAAFADAARKRSADPGTREAGGRLRFMTEEELAATLGVAAAKAILALPTPGNLAGPVEVPSGFEIVRLEMRREGSNRSLAEVRDAIRAQIGRQGQSRIFEQLIHDLHERTGVRIDDAALGSMAVHTSAPAADLVQASAR